jgi:hypothetical protein
MAAGIYKNILIRFSFAFIAFAVFFFCLSEHQAKAQVETPCDPQFMQAMEARAWLEAQREITQNQNLISKPDSVLEYTCFNQFLNTAAKNFSLAGLSRQFSETGAWETEGFTTTTTDDALTQVVGLALISYLQRNFPDPQPFLGGRLTINPDRGWNGTVDGGSAYNCNVMARVWEAAKCQNFDTRTGTPGNDGFRDFLWYSANDPRNLPSALTQCQAPADVYAIALADAFNGNQAMFVLPAASDTNPDGAPYLKDDVKTYFNLILPDACAAAIPTGVKIRRGSGNTTNPGTATSDDMICPNPGCSLVGGSCS